MSNYCRTCEEEVYRCWNSDSGCSGGGHCVECGGYNFADCDDETEEQTEMREANELLIDVLKKESDA